MRFHPEVSKFFELIGANNKFLMSKHSNGLFLINWFDPVLAEQRGYERITLGETSDKNSYTIDTCERTKVLACVDIDGKDYQPIYEHFKAIGLEPTIVVETQKGFHFLFVSPDYLYGKDIQHYEVLYTLKMFLTYRLTPALKKEFPGLVDRVFNENYTRIPVEGRQLIINEQKLYTYEEFLKKLNDYYKFTVSDKFELEDFQFIPITSKAIPITALTLLKAESECPSLREIMKYPEKHNYFDWLVFTRHMANRYLAEGGEGKADYIEKLFFEMSSRYPKYNHHQQCNQELQLQVHCS